MYVKGIKQNYRSLAAFIFMLAGVIRAEAVVKFLPPEDSLCIKGRIKSFQISNDSRLPVSVYYSIDSGRTKHPIILDSVCTEFDWAIPVIREKDIRLYAESSSYPAPSLIWACPGAHDAEIRTSELSSDGRLLLTLSIDGIIKIWDIASRAAIDSISLPTRREAFSACFGQNDQTVYASSDSLVFKWQRNTKTVEEFGNARFSDNIRKVCFNVARSYIGACSYESRAVVFDTTGKPLFDIRPDSLGELYSCRFNDAGNVFAFGGYNGIIEARNLEIPSKITRYNISSGKDPGKVVWDIDYDPAGDALAAGSQDGIVRMWSADSAILLKRYNAHSFQVRAIKFIPPEEIISGSLDNTLKFHSIASGGTLPAEINHGGQIISIDATASGDTIATAGRDRSFKLWKRNGADLSVDSIDISAKFLVRTYFEGAKLTAGERRNIPLLASHGYPREMVAGLRFRAAATVSIPFRHLQVLNYNVPPRLTGDCIIEFDIDKDEYSDTLTVFKTIALFSPSESGSLMVEVMNCEKDGYFTAETGGGTIETRGVCPEQGRGSDILAGQYPGIKSVVETGGRLKITWAAFGISEHTIEIADNGGRILQVLKVWPAVCGENISEIQISGPASGVLLISISSGDFFSGKKVLRIR